MRHQQLFLKAPAPICCLLRLAHVSHSLCCRSSQRAAGAQCSSAGTRGGRQCHPLVTEGKALVSPDSGQWEASLIAAAFPQQGVALVILGLQFAFKAGGSSRFRTAGGCSCVCHVPAGCHLPVPVPVPPATPRPHQPTHCPALPPPQNGVKIEDNKMEMHILGTRRLPAGVQAALLLLAL